MHACARVGRGSTFQGPKTIVLSSAWNAAAVYWLAVIAASWVVLGQAMPEQVAKQ